MRRLVENKHTYKQHTTWEKIYIHREYKNSHTYICMMTRGESCHFSADTDKENCIVFLFVVCCLKCERLQQYSSRKNGILFFWEFNSHYLYYVSTILKYLLVVLTYFERIRTAISTIPTRENLHKISQYPTTQIVILFTQFHTFKIRILRASFKESFWK